MKTILSSPVIDESSNGNGGGATATLPAPTGLHYGDGSTYNGGGRYAVLDPELPQAQGAKVKLELHSRNDLNLAALANQHIAAMAGNPNFLTPTPSAASFLTVYTNFQNALNAAEAAKQAQKAATATKDEMRETLIQYLNLRGDYVQGASNGNAPVIYTSGFDVKLPPSPIGELPPPLGLRVDLNGTVGKMILVWSQVSKAKSYLLECAVAGGPTLDWKLIEVGGKTTITLWNQVVGVTYVFRVAAVGGSGGRSAWSAEVSRTAA